MALFIVMRLSTSEITQVLGLVPQCLDLRVRCLGLDLDLLFEYLNLCLALRVECLDLD